MKKWINKRKLKPGFLVYAFRGKGDDRSWSFSPGTRADAMRISWWLSQSDDIIDEVEIEIENKIGIENKPEWGEEGY